VLDTQRLLICAVEDTEVSRHAVRAATWLARGLDMPLVVAHAFDRMGIAIMPRDEMVTRNITDDDLESAARVHALRLLDRAARAAGDVNVARELVEGVPVPEILRLTAERRATLLVTGTTARGGLDRVLIGSVSSELAAAAPCPVVAVPPQARLEEPGPVVAGYDGSEHSLRAARHAAGLSARLGRELVLLHVTDGEGVRADEQLVRELHAAGMRGLGTDARRPALDLEVRLSVEDGDPAATLAAVAAEESAALLVTGTRGRNTVSSALLGSVSAGLVRAARRPVVLVPATADDCLGP
jgi:nucleotide-binding universal stress UspA family protein